MSDKDGPAEKAIGMCAMVQSMIDFTAKHLYGLRTQCVTTEEITQKEIRDTETKIIKLFSRQLIAKSKLLKNDSHATLPDYPKSLQWLTVVGLSERTAQGLVEAGVTLDGLLGLEESDIHDLLLKHGADERDVTLLSLALTNLRIWTDHQIDGGDATTGSNLDLHWSNYNKSVCAYSTNSPKHSQRPSTSSLPADTYLNTQTTRPTPPPSPGYHVSHTDTPRCSPPPTPPTPRTKPALTNKYPSTPPPKKKMQLMPEVFPLTKSKSHESQLANRVTDIDLISKSMVHGRTKNKPHNLIIGGSHEMLNRRRPSTDGSDTGSYAPSGHNSPIITSPLRSPHQRLDLAQSDESYPKHNMLTVPRSPKAHLTSSRMSHSINHRLTNTFKITTCGVCHKQMFLGYKCKSCKFITKMVFGSCDICTKHVIRGRICKDCKFKCHKDCASKAAPGCSLPVEYVDLFIESLWEGSPKTRHRVASSSDNSPLLKTVKSVPAFHVPDLSSSTSSCNSSSPSSPALIVSSNSITSPSPPAPSPSIHITQFQFPEVYNSLTNNYTDDNPSSHINDVVNTNTSNDSDKTVMERDCCEGGCFPERVDSIDSQDDPASMHSWNRQHSLSVTLKEWDIPFEDLDIRDVIGTGRFGTVYKGHWHGDVAIKMLKMDPDQDNVTQLCSFKLEVSMLRKTRHDNLVLFMGACMKQPHLAIITSLCKGKTLLTLRDKFQLNKSVIIASQIAQGMGYLHARGIIHKDLKTKNIFLEKERVVITDFGLFNVTKICHENRRSECLFVPPGWLCYLAPELMRSLQAGSRHSNSDLPFSERTDVYAFGTVWYELLTGEWPFKQSPPESIIWQVGHGVKQSLSLLHITRDVKDILMKCWTFTAEKRPDFSDVLKLLERLPKKRMIRSPSHPIHLSRSAESII